MSTESNSLSLSLKSVIGFAGKVKGSLILHNNDQHILYALGSTVVIKHLLTNEQYFLHCGSSKTSVSCMQISKDGTLLATGQKTHKGFPASVWIWNLEQRTVIHTLDLYKTNIQDISFSTNNEYIATLGGEDDNKLVIWNLKTGDAICGSPAANDTATCVEFCNKDNYTLITAGKYNFRVWRFDEPNRKIWPTNCKLGSLRRIFNCLAITPDDETVYAGTHSGDLLKLSVRHALFQEKGPAKKSTFSMGIQTIKLSKDNKHIIVGTGNGTIALLNRQTLKIVRSIALAISSDSKHLITGGKDALVRIWAVDKDYQHMIASLREHQNTITHISVNEDNTEFVSASNDGSCVIWDLKKCSRINAFYASTQFTAILYHPDQSQLITSGTDRMISYWDATDLTTIRVIEGSDTGAVNCMAINYDGSYFVSGGDDRLVKLWNYDEGYTQSIGIGHSGAIAQVVISPDNRTCVSVGDEGAIMIWKMSVSLESEKK